MKFLSETRWHCCLYEKSGHKLIHTTKHQVGLSSRLPVRSAPRARGTLMESHTQGSGMLSWEEAHGGTMAESWGTRLAGLCSTSALPSGPRQKLWLCQHSSKNFLSIVHSYRVNGSKELGFKEIRNLLKDTSSVLPICSIWCNTHPVR